VLRDRRSAFAERGRALIWPRGYRRSLLEALIDEIPVGIALWDLDFRPLRWNREIGEALGLDAEGASGKSFARLRPDLWSRVREVLPLEKPLRVSLGSEPDLHWCFFPVRSRSGKAIGYGIALEHHAAAPSVNSAPLPEAGERRAVDMSEIMDTVLQGLQPMLDQRRVILTRNKMPSVVGDAAWLRRLLHLLIEESLASYRLKEPPVLTLLAVARSHSWEFVIRANGKGLSPQETSALFRPVWALRPATGGSSEFRELASRMRDWMDCQRIVEGHGGSLWLSRDEEDGGATVHFTLPFA
jgi:PAS domain S-box-containing protein